MTSHHHHRQQQQQQQREQHRNQQQKQEHRQQRRRSSSSSKASHRSTVVKSLRSSTASSSATKSRIPGKDDLSKESEAVPAISYPICPSQPVENDPPDLFDFKEASTPPNSPFNPDPQSRKPSESASPRSIESHYLTTLTSESRHLVFILGNMSNVRNMSQSDKNQIIQSLRTNRMKTLTELRRVEKVCSNSAEFHEPMTAAWAHYVNCNNLLSELRGLTKNYPFSSECLDEAKWLVIEDPASQRSWNYCWLVLVKIQNQHLIQKHASLMAQKPSMWGNRTPTAAGVAQLARTFVVEWNSALTQMLRHWESPPVTTGR
ncbi:MAG: hypothetical protein M1825_002632 [Sarcosagium campestre]|nr:MAG: hypothetical protein M1825_002632 [Sarcosagium campestre]